MSELYQCTFLCSVSWFFPFPKHTCDSEYEDVTGLQNKTETKNNTYLKREVWKETQERF
jgi:hypothetical protein